LSDPLWRGAGSPLSLRRLCRHAVSEKLDPRVPLVFKSYVHDGSLSQSQKGKSLAIAASACVLKAAVIAQKKFLSALSP
jgi:hypothetical protein